jgi:dual specificity tyrosine-phosphorylation-regulated kinase 2/3/4
VADEVED